MEYVYWETGFGVQQLCCWTSGESMEIIFTLEG
jgi:hypothetical protein